VDRAQVGVLEEAHKVSLSRLLESEHGRALEAEIGLEVLGDLTHEALERELADQQLGGLLVPADLTESHGAGAVAVRLLHAAGGRRGLARCLGGELLAGRFATGGLAGGLLGTGHFEFESGLFLMCSSCTKVGFRPRAFCRRSFIGGRS